MKLTALARAAQTIVSRNHSILIYSQPKAGKTELAGTIAKIKAVRNIYWFDIENGSDTLLNPHLGLTEAEMEKITIIKVMDTRDNPIAIETMLKALTAKTSVSICEAHGRVDCAHCTKAKAPFISFCLKDLSHNDVVVIDSGSQLGDSALAAACIGKPNMFKPTFDEYGMVNKWLGDCMSVVQQCEHTNFVVLTHEIALEDDEGKDKLFPLMGSKNFSMKCAKYFGTVIYLHKKMGKHVGGSSSTYRADLLTGSRIGAAIEKGELNMEEVLVKYGILKGDSAPSVNVNTEKGETHEEVKSGETQEAPPVEKKLTLAERLALKHKA
jgi:hypothetical protein